MSSMGCETIHPLAPSSGPVWKSSTVLMSLLAAHAGVAFPEKLQHLLQLCPSICFLLLMKTQQLGRLDLSLNKDFYSPPAQHSALEIRCLSTDISQDHRRQSIMGYHISSLPSDNSKNRRIMYLSLPVPTEQKPQYLYAFIHKFKPRRTNPKHP